MLVALQSKLSFVCDKSSTLLLCVACVRAVSMRLSVEDILQSSPPHTAWDEELHNSSQSVELWAVAVEMSASASLQSMLELMQQALVAAEVSVVHLHCCRLSAFRV